ncbi:MAG: beta-galactosidase [Chloroflexi bacterium]|nr:beta-galactosidase [Chloroflexota bacterium]
MAFPIAAQGPGPRSAGPGAEPVGDESDQVGGPGPEPVQADGRALLAAPQPQWVSSGRTPGFYAARDNRNLDPNEYNLVGGHQSFYWDQLNPLENQYEWQYIDNFIAAQVAKGKKAAIGIITFNGRANQNNPTDPPIRVPQFVFQKGAGKVNCGGFEIPKYWSPVYLNEYRKFIQALAARYDGHPNLEFIQIGVGKFGEAQPCDDQDDDCVAAAMAADGVSSWQWADIVNQITAIYADAFDYTNLLLPNAPRFKSECDRKTFSEYAVSRGVGLFPAGLYAVQEWIDLRNHPTLRGCGKYDLLLNQAEAGNITPWVPVGFEMYHYMTPDAITFFWGVAAALSRRADYITAERSVLYQGEADDPVVTPLYANIATMGWANRYLGKHIDETPSVWVALRETGYKDNWYPQKGNYSWWLIQDDNIAGGRTVPTTYRSKRQLVAEGYYDYYGEAATVNPAIEANQTFLGPSKEGWICRRTDETSGNRYMWFKIDDHYINGGPVEVTILVRYFDRGYDTWQLHYDAVGNPYKVAGTITKTNSNTWKDARFTLTDARFANGQQGGADFRIDSMGDGNEYIHFVDVAKAGGAVHSQQIPLVYNAMNDGWNLVSLRLQPSSTAVADVLASIAGKYDLVQAYQGGVWKSYQPGVGGTLTNLDHTMGFWVHVTQNAVLTVTGTPPTSTTLHLSAANGGWNLISWPSDDVRGVSTVLAGILGQVSSVYAYKADDVNDPWKLYDPLVPAYANDLSQFEPNRGFWVRVTSDADLNIEY